jgi:hypothetical protein
MRRRHALALLLAAALRPARAEAPDRRGAPPGAGKRSPGQAPDRRRALPGAVNRSPVHDPQRPDPAERQRQLEAWWARQREKEAADRFWNGPREQRRNLTRDQIERWEYQRNRRRGWPNYPF